MLFGIEQEIPLLRDNGAVFADFSNTTHDELQKIVEQLPVYQSDYPALRVGDLGIKRKRWYVEGYERFAEDGTFLASIPKSFEIRTTPHTTIQGALGELRESYRMLEILMKPKGFVPTWISFNPFHSTFQPDPPLNSYERKMRGISPESQTAEIAELTFGPDLSLSFPEFSDAENIDAAQKLTFYSPYIVPFSFSSPFADGSLWNGLSRRTFLRTGTRPSVLVFLHDEKNMIPSNPSLTQPSRTPVEAGRIEFKAFDTCCDPLLYESLFLLLHGIIRADSLTGRALVPDKVLHQQSAQHGFTDHYIAREARNVVVAARHTLNSSSTDPAFDRLESILQSNTLPVYELIDNYHATGSVIKTLQTHNNLKL